MATTISAVTDETTGNEMSDQEPRSSRLEERRAARAASPARAAVSELAATGALDGLFGRIGDVDLAVPRDRDGSFTPRLVPSNAT